MSTPIEVLREATRAVPAVRYALGVAGILAAVALVRGFGLEPRTAALGALGMLALMVALVVFARLTQTAPRHFLAPTLALMWSMLVITVASAALLFSSVFFDWPLSMSRLISLAPAPERLAPSSATSASGAAADPSATRVAGPHAPPPELGAARSQAAAGDFAGAWQTLAQAPPEEATLRERARLAMHWLREMHAPGDVTFSEQVKPLLPALHRVAAGADAAFAADALAHIGWGHFLQWREGGASAESIEALYAQAAERDSANPYAHAFWAHWLLWRNRQSAEAKTHFAAALSSGREAAWVRKMAFAAYSNADARRELLETILAMRAAGDSLPSETRRRAASRLYAGGRNDEFLELSASFDPPEHLAAYDWLLADSETTDRRVVWRGAQLAAAAGDCARARRDYESLLTDDLSFASPEQLRAELAACKPRA